MEAGIIVRYFGATKEYRNFDICDAEVVKVTKTQTHCRLITSGAIKKFRISDNSEIGGTRRWIKL